MGGNGNGKTPKKSGANGKIARDGNGRFAPGNCGGPGRKPGTGITDQLRKLLTENNGAVAKELAAMILDAAKEKDFRFMKEVLDRMEGKIPDHVTVDGDVAYRVEMPLPRTARIDTHGDN